MRIPANIWKIKVLSDQKDWFHLRFDLVSIFSGTCTYPFWSDFSLVPNFNKKKYLLFLCRVRVACKNIPKTIHTRDIFIETILSTICFFSHLGKIFNRKIWNDPLIPLQYYWLWKKLYKSNWQSNKKILMNFLLSNFKFCRNKF